MFQSTRPHGARPLGLSEPIQQPNSFNPRARMGRDLSNLISYEIRMSFNPRARMGRDLYAATSQQRP